jgi:hypothetical protein
MCTQVSGRRAERIGLVALGAIASLAVLDAFRFDWVLEVGIERAVLSGSLGMWFLPLAIALAGLVAARTPVRAGLALGLLVPTGVALAVDLRLVGWLAPVAWIAMAAACLAIAARAVRESDEPAALRLVLTAIGVGALLCCALATLCWWPRHYGMGGYGDRVHPTFHVVGAVILLRWALRDLFARRSRALFSIAGAGILIALSPTLGSVQAGCMTAPGPLEVLLAPQLFAPAILLLWIGPVVRFLRGAEPPLRS